MKFTKIAVAVLSLSLILSACGSSPESNTSTAQNPAGSTAEEKASESTSAAQNTTDNAYFKKYAPPVTLTYHRVVTKDTLFQDNDTAEDNAWTRWQKENYGIEWKLVWSAPDDTTDKQKLDLAFASGDLPDVINPNPTQLSKYVKAGMIAPLDDMIDKCFSPLVKWAIDDATTQTQGALFKPATLNGKIYAMPVMTDTIIFWNNGFTRMDILKELGKTMPTTLKELEDVFAAYRAKYPGKYPLAIDKDLGAMQIAAAPYKAGFGHWVQLGDGTLGYGSIQPEAKQTLAKMAEWYKKGYFDPEFVVKGGEKMQEDVIAGNFLTYYGVWASIAIPFTPLWKNVPTANPEIMPFLNGEDGQTRVYAKPWFENLRAITANCKNPEALFYLMNENWDSQYRNDKEIRSIMKEKYNYTFKYPATELRDPLNKDQVAKDHPTAGELAQLWKYDYPEEVQGMGYFNNYYTHWAYIQGFTGAPVTVMNRDLKSMAIACRENDESLLTVEGKKMLMSWNDSHPNMVTNWAQTEKYWSEFEKSGNYVADLYAGATTDLMAEKSAYLKKLEQETCTRIIMGDKPISEFDTFVENWNRNGGTDITREVNEWYNNNR